MTSNPSFADVVHALNRCSERSSKATANKVLESVTGTTSLRNVDPAKYAAVIAALDGSPRPNGGAAALDNDEDYSREPTIDADTIYNRWNNCRRGVALRAADE